MRTVTDWLGEYGASHTKTHQQAVALAVRAADRVVGVWNALVGAGSEVFTGVSPWLNWATIAAAVAPRLLPHTVPSVGGGRARRFHTSTAHHTVAHEPAVAALAHLTGDFRGRLGRPVHRPRRRGETAVLLQGRAVPVDRAAVAGRRGVPPAGVGVLKPGTSSASSGAPRSASA